MNRAITLPNGATATLIFLREFPALYDMIYLQSIRSGLMNADSPVATQYRVMAPIYAHRLAALVLQHVEPSAVAAVTPPSSRNDAHPYLTAIRASLNASDLSPGFSRRGRVRAAVTGSLNELEAEFSYSASGIEPTIRSLVIVDDCFASGRSAASMVQHIRRAGLADNCRIIVAVPAAFPSDL